MCDCLVALPAATTHGTALFAKNSDRPPAEVQDLCWLPPRRDRGRLRVTHIDVEPASGDTLGVLASRPRWCWGAEHGVNEAGVAIGNEAIYTTLDPRTRPPALIGMDLVRLGLERAASARDAVEVITALLERHGQGGSGHAPPASRPYWSSFLLADPAEAWVVETSGREWAAEPVPRASGVRAVSNRTTIPAFDAAHRHPRQPVERLVDPRWHRSQRVLAEQPVGVVSLQDHLRSHEPVGAPGWSVCMHVPEVEVTTASMVAELAPGGRPSRAWCLLGSPCRSVYVPIVVGEPLGGVPDGSRFAALTDADAGRLRELEVWLAAELPPAAVGWDQVDALLVSLGR